MSRVPPMLTRSTERGHRVIVFATPSCSWCVRAKQYLSERNVKFREVDVTRDPAAARDPVRRSVLRTAAVAA